MYRFYQSLRKTTVLTSIILGINFLQLYFQPANVFPNDVSGSMNAHTWNYFRSLHLTSILKYQKFAFHPLLNGQVLHLGYETKMTIRFVICTKRQLYYIFQEKILQYFNISRSFRLINNRKCGRMRQTKKEHVLFRFSLWGITTCTVIFVTE